jgi:hypothetical protein
MLLMGVGQESENPRVAITGKIVEAGAPIQVTTETDVREFRWCGARLRGLPQRQDERPIARLSVSHLA